MRDFEGSLKNSTSTQVERRNEVFNLENEWRSVSLTDAFVHCPDFGSKSKFYRSRPSPHNLDLELEVNEDDIEELIMGHEEELTTEELQEILNGEHQETQRNVSPSEQVEDGRGPMPTSAIKDLLKKWEAVRAMVFEWHPNQADVSRVGDLYNNNAINYFWKILKKREKQSTLDVFLNAP
ncbi:uncharacterized protein TNCV_3144831 [Trichonephila clavipes]|nr:uncharacterized protein TNCV_3144831 [Trichonephila clavipes]